MAWLITDNILLAYECMHAIKRKKGNTGIGVAKLDMHKAYERVEWTFLERKGGVDFPECIMLKMGSDRRWVDLIMACVVFVR